MTSAVRTSTKAGFDVLELDSPASRNALSIAMLTALIDAVASSTASPSRGLLFTHSGPAFCAGVDLKERSRADAADGTHSDLFARLLQGLIAYPKPLVCWVDGAVRGGGMGIVACADCAIGTPAATFAYSETRVGVAPALVMAVTMIARTADGLVPHMLDGAAFDVGTARRLGLIDLIAQPQDDEPERTLTELRRGAPAAQQTVKRMFRHWRGRDATELMGAATALSAELFATAEAAEGSAAFAEKRVPSWVADLSDD